MSSRELAYVLIVADGAALHAIYPNALDPEGTRAVEGIILRLGIGSAAETAAPDPMERLLEGTIRHATLREAARASGFTGDVCGRCGNMQMTRSGSCLTCRACGSTTGCS